MNVQKIKDAIEKSKSWTQVCNKTLGIKSSHRIKKLRALADENNIDYSHFINNKKIPTSEKECPVCGSKFETIVGHKKREKTTCSHSCSNTYFRKCWSDTYDYHNYRSRAIRHYGSKCKKCGESRPYVLQVHHKDCNRENNEIENLMVLCANCHLETHFLMKNNIDD